ncbi:MAG TPA: MarR family transcriptional regulator [Actinomycetota bacterium]|nr:MarR family transcriptional regulator [Actinomycetota bacterium]
MEMQDAAEELAELVPRLYRLLRTALDVEPGSPSLEQLRVMHRIDEGLHHVSALAAARQMRMSAITAILDVLVDREWVERVPDTADRRRTFVNLTAAGHEALAHGRACTTRRMAAVLEGLPESVADAVRALTGAVADYDARLVAAREAQANRSMPRAPATRQ